MSLHRHKTTKNWTIYFTDVNGKRTTKSLGHPNEPLAQVQYKEFMDELKRKKTSTLRLSDIIEEYVKSTDKKRTERTLKEARTQWRYFQNFFNGSFK